MTVVKEFVKLLTDDMIVIGVVVATHLAERVSGPLEIIYSCLTCNHLLHGVKVLRGNEEDLFRLNRLLDLILEDHDHEVEEDGHGVVV